MANSKELFIFYSWQTDSPDSTNRRAIRHALRTASSKLEAEFSKDGLRLVPDEATRDAPGSPNIPQRIIERIELSHIFLCDVTTINIGATNVKRKTPNPNVIYELGYAVARLGWDRIVMLFNKEFGELDDLPFDIDRHRASPYRLKEVPNGKPSQGNLDELVYKALKLIIEKNPPFAARPFNPEEERRRRDVNNLRWMMANVHWPTVEEYLGEAPGFVSSRSLHFYEGFHGVFRSKSFHLYDRQLFDKIKKVHDLWHQSLSFFAHYEAHMAREGSVFSARRPIWTEAQERDWDRMVRLLKKLEPAVDELLKDVRERYLEINLEETDQTAWGAFMAFQNKFERMLTGVKRPHKKKSKRKNENPNGSVGP